MMYGRSFNGFMDFSQTPLADMEETVPAILQAWQEFQEAILPGIQNRTLEVKKSQKD